MNTPVSPEKVKLAVKRTVSEAAFGVLSGRVFSRIRQARIETAYGFFPIANSALEFSWIAAAFNVFDSGRDVSALPWLLEKVPQLRARATKVGLTGDRIKEQQRVLKKLRDRYYFHIDSTHLGKLSDLQKDFKSAETHKCLILSYRCLAQTYFDLFGKENGYALPMKRYNGKDAFHIARLAESSGLTCNSFQSREGRAFSSLMGWDKREAMQQRTARKSH